MCRVTAELTWLSRLLTEFSVPHITPISVRYDGQAAIHIARNPVYHEHTKHIEIDCHFVREKLQDGLISLHYIATKDQPADGFTKSLPSHKHHGFMSMLGVSPPPT